MDKYTVKLYARAYQDLEEIYSYIANSLLEPDTALNMVDALETAILSLAQFPERGAIRRVGAYSNKDCLFSSMDHFACQGRPLKTGVLSILDM